MSDPELLECLYIASIHRDPEDSPRMKIAALRMANMTGSLKHSLSGAGLGPSPNNYQVQALVNVDVDTPELMQRSEKA
jgi:hypothetical protein